MRRENARCFVVLIGLNGHWSRHWCLFNCLSTTIRAGVTSWSPAHSCPHHHCTTLLLFDYCTVVMQPLYHITPYCTRSHHNNQRSPSHNLGYKGYNQGFVKGDKLCLYPDFFGCRSILSMSKIKVKISETKFLSFYETLGLVEDLIYN